MANADRDADRFDADEAGRREFTKARKGFDPVEVRAHLLSMASEIKRLQAKEADLVRRVDQLERDAADQESLDPGAVTRALGEETVRVIEAARVAAAEIRSKAEEGAARLVAEAHERANRLTQDATELRDNASRDAEALTADAQRRAGELLAEATESADGIRSAAQADADQWRDEASGLLEQRTAEAETAAEEIRRAAAEAAAEERSAAVEAAAVELETAREQGREMLQEARDARERILRDLAERRQTARRQLEALRAGRERLLESFAAARQALDDATDEIVDALPAARDAADQAARDVREDLEVAIDELDREASGDGVGRLLVDDGSVPTGSPDVAADDDPAAPDLPTVDAGEPAPAEGGEVDDAGPGSKEAEVRAEEAVDGSVLSASDPDSPPSTDVPVEDAGDAPNERRLHLVGTPSPMAPADDDGGGPAQVEQIFAKLRAADVAAEDDEHEDDDGIDDDGTDDDDIDDDGAAPLATVTTIGEGGVVEQSAATTGSQEVGDSQDVLDLRDSVLGELDRTLARRLKRIVSDQENAVLDRVRRERRSRSAEDLLGPASEASATFVDGLRADLVEIVECGRVFVDGRLGTSVVGDATAAVDTLAASISDWVGDPLRARLSRVIDETDDSTAERAELVERLRAAYREWRNEKLPELAGDLTTMAFNLGVRRALPEGTTLCWLVDHGGLPCPDAEDNHLAGALALGEAFPTGDLAPPAHPGCRCLLSPLSR